MKSRSWHFVDKSAWGDGPWQDEPDKKQWVDQETHLPCLIVRSRVTGSLCGYVGVPASHPWYGKSYNDIHQEYEVTVHGGLTFAGTCDGEPRGVCHIVEDGEDDNVWWVGFDCAHAWDLTPSSVAIMRAIYDAKGEFYHRRIDDIYRDETYVADCIRLLAAQAKGAEKEEEDRSAMY